MITEVHIQNFKSIQDLRLKLGRVTVLIGENGCGKSNILEAIAFASAAANRKLDNEFLVSRGIRITEPRFMRTAFDSDSIDEISIVITQDTKSAVHYRLSHQDDAEYARWQDKGLIDVFGLKGHDRSISINLPTQIAEPRLPQEPPSTDVAAALKKLEESLSSLQNVLRQHGFSPAQEESTRQFLVYSPENSSLRTFEREGQILPLGIKGEGLFKLLKHLSEEENKMRLEELKEHLQLIDWFGDFRVASSLSPFETTLQIKDRYTAEQLEYFDQRSANEGFLFLLFYFSLFISQSTPTFFAIDNIDASLNPKLCSELLRRLVRLAESYSKQVILTTHNPAVLDGLNLNDDEQRLLVVYRNSKGHTKARRVTPPEPVAGEPPAKLSEAFLRGILGGLPQNF